MKIFKLNEFLFVLYLFLFPLLSILTQSIEGISTVLLFTITLSILGVSFFYNNLVFNKRSILVISIILIFLLIELVFRSNSLSTTYIYNFMIYGAITIYLYSCVKDKKKVLIYYIYFSLFLFLGYCTDPFRGYVFSGDYMGFGYNYLLPAFTGLYIGRKIFKIKWMIIFEILAFTELVIFANKGAILTAVFVIFIYNVIFFGKTINRSNFKIWIFKKLSLFICMAFVMYLLWINALDIVEYLIQIAAANNYSSYSLDTIRKVIVYGDIEYGLSGRDLIWDEAKSFIHNAPLIGSGTASFHSFYGRYTHNFILEILTSYGVIGLLIFLVFFANSCIALFKSKLFNKVFGVLMLSLWFIPLMFSLYIFVSKEFWVFMMIGIEGFRFNKSHST